MKLWFAQLGALIAKEFEQIRRDPSSLLVAVILPLIFLLLFGFGITLDAGVLKIAFLDQSRGTQSLSLAADFAHSPWFDSIAAPDMPTAAKMMRNSEIQGIVAIRENFDSRLAAGQSGEIQIIIDGAEPNNAQYIRNYSQGLIASWQAAHNPGGAPISLPINPQPRYWYNPAAKSVYFLVPGAITVIMTLIGTLLTSLVFAREWERGTMEALITTPVSRMQLLLGKIVPYFCMGMFSMALCAIAATTLFAIPFRGSIGALALVSSVFMISALGQGLLISVCLRAQLVAAEAGMFSGFLPALILSGFVFDIDSMVAPMRFLAHALPATYMNQCLRSLFLAGDDWNLLLPNMLFMGGIGLAMLCVVYHKLVKRLD